MFPLCYYVFVSICKSLLVPNVERRSKQKEEAALRKVLPCFRVGSEVLGTLPEVSCAGTPLIH